MAANREHIARMKEIVRCFLDVIAQCERRVDQRRPACRLQRGGQPMRRSAMWIVPDKDDPVDLATRLHAQAGAWRRLRAIPRCCAGAACVEAEAMEWAADLFALDRAAEAEVSAHVRAERVAHAHSAAPCTKNDNIAASELSGQKCARGELVRKGNSIPALRNGQLSAWDQRNLLSCTGGMSVARLTARQRLR